MDFRQFTRRMETAFEQDFSGVTFDRSLEAKSVTEPLGAAAATRGQVIHLSPLFFLYGEPQQQFILAHEFAHVAQKRRPSGPPSEARSPAARRLLLECDATQTACAALAGRPARCRMADHPDGVSPWGPAGHYYTSLFIMLAAGGDTQKCFRRAFFCQMPDQVYEFDAIAAAVDYLQMDDPWAVPGLSAPATPPEDIEKRFQLRWGLGGAGPAPMLTYAETPQSVARRRQIDRQISKGLHCLTGRKGADEVRIRGEALDKYGNDDVRFGVGLHSYGDSFAHQDEHGAMYPPIRGHATAGHTPDNCKDHAVQYIRYIAGLYRIAERSMAIQSRLSFNDVVFALEPVWKMKFDGDDEAIQTKHSQLIASIACKTGLCSKGQIDSYKPEHEKISYWKHFWPRHCSKLFPEGPSTIMCIVRQCGEEWAR